MKKGELSKLINSLNYEKEAPRDYIGASSIGAPCMRALWYEFNHYPKEEPLNKTKRTWEIGKAIESLVLDWIEQTGKEIARVWYDLEDEELPYFRGHVDAMFLDKTGAASEILEIKTAKDASFNLFIKNGLKKWQPKYYDQLQSYMGMSGITKATILVLNKDTSDLMDEQIEFDPRCYQELKVKAQYIYESKEPPNKISHNKLWFQCKMCAYRMECHQ